MPIQWIFGWAYIYIQKIMKKIYIIGVLSVLFLSVSHLSAQVPTNEATKPDYLAANVMSLYSDEYTTGVTFQVLGWGQAATLAYVGVGTGEAMEITNLQWIPLQINPKQNVHTMSYVHIDVFSNEVTPFRFGFVQYGIDGNPLTEIYTPHVILEAGKWNSFDYPVSYFTDRDLSMWGLNVLRFGDDDGTVYSKKIYVDNIYFFNGIAKNPYVASGVNSIKSEKALNLYPTTVTDKMTIESVENIKEVRIYNATGQMVRTFEINGFKNELNLSNLNPGCYIISSDFSTGETISKRIIKL